MNRGRLAIALGALAASAVIAASIALRPLGAVPGPTPTTTAPGPSPTRIGAAIKVGPVASVVAAPYDQSIHRLPLSESPQRRTWWAGGRWWAILPDPTSEGWGLFAGGDPGGPWTAQGILDDRRRVQIDVAVRGDELLVAAAGTGGERDALRVSRYALEDGRYRLLPDAPIEVVPTGVRALSAAFGPEGDAWLAYVVDGRLAVSRGIDGGATWEPAPRFAAEAAKRTPTVASLIATESGVAVVWTTEGSGRIWVERAAGSGWDEKEIELGGESTGRLSVVAAPGDGGAVLVLATLRDLGGGQAPAIVIVRDIAGEAPSIALVARQIDRMTDPVLTLVPSAAAVAVTATIPTDSGGAVVVAKVALVESLSFATGRGDIVLDGGTDGILRDPLTPAVAAADGQLTVIAVDPFAGAIHAGVVEVGVGEAADPPGELSPATVTALVRHGFDAQPVGIPPSGWTLRRAEPSGSMTIADGEAQGRVLRMTGASATSSRACLGFRGVGSGKVVAAVSIRVVTIGTGDTWLALRGRGDAASIRFDDDRRIAYRAGSTKTWTSASFVPGRWYRWTVTVDLAGGSYAWTLGGPSGSTIAAVRDVPWDADPTEPIDLLCLEVPAGPNAPTLEVDDVTIDHRHVAAP